MSSQVPAPDRKALLKQALTALDDMQAKLDASARARREPIAIVGMSCRLPGGIESPEALWQVLDGGVDAVTEVPRDRWNIDDYYDADVRAPGKMCTRRGGFLQQVDRFDPQFFGVAPREAQSMDPQHRLLLEVAWEALERAGQAPDRLQGTSTGVFVGITTSDYRDLIDFKDPQHSDVYAATGNALNAAAGRLAFTLGLQGPCMAVDTACSSSLVALHNACLSLRNGESDLALAAGVNVMLAPETFVLFSKWGMLAPDGRCKTFDARADGFVRGEGCVLVVLKRLSDAVKNGDDILAVVRGSAVNQDGRSSGLTVPNGPAQQAVIRRALASAGVQPGDVSYVEAHGTGTPLGDPIEVEALAAAFGKNRREPLAIGSIKTNIGHVEAASGLAGLMKVVLSLRHERIPKHLHFESPNPRIDWDAMPIRVAAQAQSWQRSERPRLAGVSSFGFSGTNAHVILEEAPAAAPGPDVAGGLQVLTLSAKTPRALATLAAAYERTLSLNNANLPDICFTANAGRAQFAHRIAVLGAAPAEMAARLVALSAGDVPAGAFRAEAAANDARKLAFLFTGQGSQYPGMGRGLYDGEPVFRASMDRCAEILRDHMAVPLIDAVYGAAADGLTQTGCTQPALFALEYSLAQLWRSWGVVPTIVLGHSVGEYVAACVAGVFDLEDALKLIAARARLMQALPAGGAMAAVFASETVVAPVIAAVGGPIALAAINGPASVVVSGTSAAVAAVLDRLAAAGVKSQPLAVSHAFHSPLMEPMLAEFEAIASGITYRSPQIALVSNETGKVVRPGEIDAAYWRRHIRAAVQFNRSIADVRASGCELFLEAGPSPTLLGLGRRAVDGGTWLPSLRQGKDDRAEMLASAAALYTRGIAVDFSALTAESARRRVVLPTYPFERQRFWIRESNGSTLEAARPSRSRETTLAGRRLSSPLAEIQFETELSADGWLAEHVIHGAIVFPATGHIELAREAAHRALGHDDFAITAIANHEPLMVPSQGACRVQVVIQPTVDGAAAFRILSTAGTDATETAPWQLHVSGVVRLGESTVTVGAGDILGAARARCQDVVDVDAYYAEMSARGLQYGPRFRGVTALWEGNGEAIGRVELPAADDGPRVAGGVHPALLDSCFHVVGRAIAPDARGQAYLPVGTDRVIVTATTTGPVWSHAVVRESDATTLSASIRLFDDDGRLVAAIEGLRLRRMAAATLARWAGADEKQWLHDVQWTAAPLGDVAAPQLGTWLVFADRQGIAAAFSRERQAAGDVVISVRTEGHHDQAPGDITIDPEQSDAYVNLIQGPASQLRGVVFGWGLDVAAGEGDLIDASQAACRHLLFVAQALLRDEVATPTTPLVVVTRGAAPVETAVDVSQASFAGLLRSVAREHARLRYVTLDLDPRDSAGVDTIARETAAADAEEDVVYRGGTRYVRRLTATQASSNAAANGSAPVRLEIRERGLLDNLQAVTVERRSPAAGEVEIEVRAAGLNFRDVLNALGMYPGDAGALGSDCAGVVTQVGPDVTHLQVGDEVVGLMTGCFGTYVTGSAALLEKKPARLSFADAVTAPNAFLTAQYALEQIGGMRAGERVLIHAATGGVGLAAVQLARAAGAEIFATAGSPRKRAFLQAMGVQHVMDSRSLAFADEIAIVTEGGGVDLVLNSISGPAIERSLESLAPGGRFLEIGKNGIWTAEEVSRVRQDVRYAIIDLGEAILADVRTIRAPYLDLLSRLGAGQLDPLPTEVFPLTNAIAAFRHMAAARHIGKIVIAPASPSATSDASEFNCAPDATYLVTGGFGGLGLATAEWLATRGAKQLMLIGRRAPSGPARAQVDALKAAGVDVMEAFGDVSSRAFLTDALGQVAASGRPLRGVVHAAGVLADAPVQQLTSRQFGEVWAPKAAGAWNLHELTAGQPIDLFVMFSSMSAVLGAPGQASYTAANAFLDALGHARRARGLAAISINWGPWSEVGMAAGLQERDRQRWAAQGIGRIAPDQGLRAMEEAIRIGLPQISVLPIDWKRFVDANAHSNVPVLRTIARQLGTPASSGASRPFAERLAAADPQDRADLLLELVRDAVGAVLALDGSDLSETKGLTDIGMDSLMAVELSNRLSGAISRPLPTTLAFEQPTVAALTGFIGELLGVAPRAPRGTSDAPASRNATDDVDGLTDDEVAASLAAELEQAGY